MIRIVTDTDANLPQEVIEEFRIGVAPIHLIFGDEVLRERVDISDAESYARMAAAPELPKTSQPPASEFLSIYERMLAEDPRATILSIHISSLLSGTVNSARQAAAMYPDADIRIFDTRSASFGQSLMVRHAADMARRGASVDAILERLSQMRDDMRVFFVLETLEYLARGGRIGRAAHLLGTLLDLKPILTVTEGIIDAHSRHRTRRRALAALRALVMEDARPGPNLHMGVIHAVSEEPARQLHDELVASLSPGVMLFGELGPGLGVHTGPGALGVCWVHVPD